MAEEKVKEEGEVKEEVIETNSVVDKKDVVEDKAPEEVADEYTEEEQAALEAGWKPKDQWEGDPKKWVPADEFNRRGELFGKIDHVSKDLRETKKALRMLQEHHAKVKQTEYNRALASLKAQKKQAMQDGDADRVLEIDDTIMDIKAAEKVAAQNSRQEQATPDPRFLAWMEKNPWYAQDVEMKEFADDVGIAHSKTHPEKAPEDVLKYVEQRVRKSYPEKFSNPNRSKPSAVAGRDVQSANKRSDDSFKLSDEEHKVMMTFVNEGIMTKEQYIADLRSIKGV